MAGKLQYNSPKAIIDRHIKVYRDTTVLVEGPCWEYNGSLSDGYGDIRPLKHRLGESRAHRLSYRIYKLNGELIPEGLNIMHACDNPKCVNPGHLSLGTQQQNLIDAAKKNRTAKKIDKGQVIEIRGLWATGNYLIKELAATFDVNQSTIGRIVKGETHQYV